MSDKELLENIKTREELRKRGYTQETCKTCGGTGHHQAGHKCFVCDGRGFRWNAPMMRCL